MKIKRRVRKLVCMAVFAAATACAQAVIYKADNTTPLNDAASWDGGTAPTDADIAAWDSRVGAGNVTVVIGGALTWDGLLLTDPADAVTINGTDKLTLDGGAITDIDMSAATRDLTINTTAVLGGSSAVAVNAGRVLTFNGSTWAGGLTKSGDGRLVFAGNAGFGNSVLTAGETVWASAATASGDTKIAGGVLTLKGNTLISAGNAEVLAVYNGTLVLDGGAFSMTNASSRVFVGRTDSTSDGLMIVSNGTHRIEGANNGAMANFVGVSNAKRGRLFMEDGSLAVKYLRLATNNKGGQVAGEPDEIVVNGGTLTAEGTSFGFMMATYFDENMLGNSDRSGRLTLNGGRFQIPNGLTLITPDSVGGTHAGSADILLNGGVWAVKQLKFGNDLNVARSLTFDGGTLEGTNAVNGVELVLNPPAVKVRAGSAFLSAAAGSDCRVTANFEEDPASRGGALVKTGPGRLALSGQHAVSGPVIVSNGVLCLTGSLLAQTNLVVSAGAGVSLADGVLSTYEPTRLCIGSAIEPSVLELEVAASGSACDVFAVPTGAWFQNVAVALVQQGTRFPIARAGDFPIMTYAGTRPSVGNLSWGNPVTGFTCTFSIDSVTCTVYAHVAADLGAGESVWIHDGGGVWSDPANWNVMPGNTPGTRVLLGSLPTAPATVTLDTAATVGQMIFSNANAYALSGAGSLTLDNGTASPVLAIVQGVSHSVAVPLAPAANLAVSTPSGALLSLGGVISGIAGLVKQGSGDVLLTADNSYAGGTTIQGGVLALAAGASAGTGPISIAANGARLRAAGANPVTITNTVVIATSGGMIDATAPMTLTGPFDWAPGQYEVHKTGVSDLIFKGTATETGNYRIRHRTGTFRVADGARLDLNSPVRDTIYMADGITGPRTFIVETGAVVVAGGLLTGSGPSNTVYVNGGSLTLLGSGVDGESGLIRTVTDVEGVDRIIVDAGSLTFSVDDWLSMGVRGGGAEIIVNGGTATFGRLSLGVRGDVTFSSSGVYTYADVRVNGGVMDVAGAFNWMGDVMVGRTNHVYLNGGTLRLPATLRSVASTIANASDLTLNGGTLELRGQGNFGVTSLDNYLSGLNALYVDQGGAVIDTFGLSATITQELQRVGSTTGGLTKRGAGTLTFSGACGAVGTTAVEAGTLRFASTTATTGLSLSNQAKLSLRNGAFDVLTLSEVSWASGARLDLDVASDSASCDRLTLPEGATVGTLVIGLYNVGTDSPVTHADTFALFAYTGTPPDVSGWTLAPECFGLTCTFVVNSGAQTIDAQLATTDTQVTWAQTGAGDWSVAGNWWPQAPAAAGAVTRFGNALTADAVINVDAPVSVAGMIFDHTYRYTLSGSPVTFDNGGNAAVISVSQGSHTLASALTLSGGTIAAVAAGAELKVTDVASGTGTLTVQGGGTLTLEGTNVTPTTVRDGAAIAVPTVDSLSGLDLTLDGGGLRVSTSGTLAGNVALGAAGGAFSAGTGQTLVLDATVTGAGGLTKNGAGTVTLGASADGYAGATTSDGGTLSVSEMPAGALVFGRGTFAFTGTSGASAQPVMIASDTHAAVLRADGDVTLSGLLSTGSGALFKRGVGTVTIAGAHTNRIGIANAANMSGAALSGVDGDGPSAGFGAFNIAEGRVTLGEDGQTNTVSGALLVGLNTTSAAGAETAGELVVGGGLTTCSDWVYIGRNNGTTVTAPSGLSSRLLVQAGELNTVNLSLGGASGFSGYTGRPVLEIQGGLCTVQTLLYAGETLGGVSTLWVNGGILRHLATTATSLRLGNTGGEGVLRITAGAADLAIDVILGAGGVGSTGTVELAGGVLTARNIYELTAAGTSRMIFNGGVFRPTGGGMSGLDSAKIGAAPAIFDTSLYAGTGYNLAQVLSGVDATDGGFVKAGTNTLIINAAMAYSGSTLVSGGVLRVQGSLPAASALAVAPGARLMLNNTAVKTVTVSGLTLGDAVDTSPAELEFGVNSADATNDRIVVNGDVTAHHAAFYLFWQSSQTDNIVANGRYELVRWTGTGPSTVEAFSVANPQGGKAYTFTIEGTSLWLTVGGATTGAHVWTSTGGGDWSESAKWALAPEAGAVGAIVRFDESTAAEAAVRLNQNTTVGQLFFNSTNAYALTSDGVSVMTVDNGANAAVVQIEQGRHVVAAPVALQGEVDIKPISGTGVTLSGSLSGSGGIVKQNGGDLVLGAVNSFTGGVRLTGGAVFLTNGATAGTGTLAFEIDGSPVRVSGSVPSELPGNVAVRTSQAVVNVDPQAALRVAGELIYQDASHVTNTLVKQGGGEMVLAGRANAPRDNARINIQEGSLRFSSGADYRIGNVGRDVIKMDSDNSRARTLVVDAGAKAVLSGIYMAYGTNAIMVDGRLDFSGDFDVVSMRVQSNVAVDRFTVRSGGTVTCPQAAWFNVGVRGSGVLAVEGGAAQLGSVSLGYQQRPLDYYGGAYGRVFMTEGGRLDVTGKWNWMGDSNNVARVNMVQVGDGTSAGTALRLPPTTQTTADGWSSLGLNKGTLVTTGAGLTAPVAGDYLYGLKQIYVSGNGGTIDTAGQTVTFAQPVCSDQAGGTLAKAGAGSLTLTQPLRWDGLVDVQGGTLSATLEPATVRQSYPSNLVTRIGFENGPAADTSGNGNHGLLRGAAVMGAGTNGLYGLTFATGASSVCAPCTPVMRGMDRFSVAMWLWVNATNAAANTVTTFFTTRKDGGSNGPYEFMLRMNYGRVRFMTTGAVLGSWQSYDTTGWIPGPNQWVHVACAVTPSGVTIYINGVLARSPGAGDLKTILFCPPDRSLNDYGFGFGNYQLAAPGSAQFTGRLDDVRVYSHALSQAEVQALIGTVPEMPDLRVAGGAIFMPQQDAEVRDLSGEGYVSGALTVRGSVAPGDSADAPAGAVLSAAALTLGTNMVCRWTWTPTANDELHVGDLTVDGAGVVDLGRQEGDLITGSFRAVLMRYDTITGPEKFADWRLQGAGGKGYVAGVKAENNEVVLEFSSTRGTLMWLK